MASTVTARWFAARLDAETAAIYLTGQASERSAQEWIDAPDAAPGMLVVSGADRDAAMRDAVIKFGEIKSWWQAELDTDGTIYLIGPMNHSQANSWVAASRSRSIAVFAASKEEARTIAAAHFATEDRFRATREWTAAPVVDFEAVGREAYKNGDMAAPALNAQVQQALKGLPVGGGGADIMLAFSRGYDAERDAAAAAILAED